MKQEENQGCKNFGMSTVLLFISGEVISLKTSIMEKRDGERIQANLDVNYYCGNTVCRGTVTNISEKGMFINTKIEFPFDLNFELHIALDNEILKAPATVKRIVRTDNYYGGIGVELQDPAGNYLEFIGRLKREKKEE